MSAFAEIAEGLGRIVTGSGISTRACVAVGAVLLALHVRGAFERRRIRRALHGIAACVDENDRVAGERLGTLEHGLGLLRIGPPEPPRMETGPVVHESWRRGRNLKLRESKSST